MHTSANDILLMPKFSNKKYMDDVIACHGVFDCIEESHSLWNASHWMKGVSKEDSMLLIYRVQVI